MPDFMDFGIFATRSVAAYVSQGLATSLVERGIRISIQMTYTVKANMKFRRKVRKIVDR